MARHPACLTDAEAVAVLERAHQEGRLNSGVAEDFWRNFPHLRYRIPDDLLAEIKRIVRECQAKRVKGWDRRGRPAEEAVELWNRELGGLAALLESDPPLYAALKNAAEAKEMADDRARGIPVKRAGIRNVFTGELVPAERARPRRGQPVRQRGAARRVRTASPRVRGSRRGLSRAFSRGGDSGDPDEPPGEPHSPETCGSERAVR